jgi:hypothetical protein
MEVFSAHFPFNFLLLCTYTLGKVYRRKKVLPLIRQNENFNEITLSLKMVMWKGWEVFESYGTREMNEEKVEFQ